VNLVVGLIGFGAGKLKLPPLSLSMFNVTNEGGKGGEGGKEIGAGGGGGGGGGGARGPGAGGGGPGGAGGGYGGIVRARQLTDAGAPTSLRVANLSLLGASIVDREPVSDETFIGDVGIYSLPDAHLPVTVPWTVFLSLLKTKAPPVDTDLAVVVRDPDRNVVARAPFAIDRASGPPGMPMTVQIVPVPVRISRVGLWWIDVFAGVVRLAEIPVDVRFPVRDGG
jgi:hypothetical protein